MLHQIDASNRIGERVALRAMFAARKQVFVDLLKWDIPVLDGRFEIDQFDDGHANYIILTDPECRHLASARLLPTNRPAILTEIYPNLCDQPPPTGPHVYEITRFCLSPHMRAQERRRCRNTLVTALARYALDNGIETYTGVAERGWLRQIQAFGWSCRLLGQPRSIGHSEIGALRIDIEPTTIEKLERAGIVSSPHDDMPLQRAA